MYGTVDGTGPRQYEEVPSISALLLKSSITRFRDDEHVDFVSQDFNNAS